MDLDVLIVLMGRDSSHRLVAPKRHEELGGRVGKVRILPRCEELKLIEDQGGDPVGIMPVDSPRELDECLELPSVPQFDRTYRNRDRARHACPPTDEEPHLTMPVGGPEAST